MTRYLLHFSRRTEKLSHFQAVELTQTDEELEKMIEDWNKSKAATFVKESKDELVNQIIDIKRADREEYLRNVKDILSSIETMRNDVYDYVDATEREFKK